MRLRLIGVILFGLELAAGDASAITAVGKSGVIAPAKPAEKPPPKKAAKKPHPPAAAKAAATPATPTPTPAAVADKAASIGVGDQCTLKKPLKTTTAKGKAATLRSGGTYRVNAFEKDVAVLTAGEGVWRAKRKLLGPVCTINGGGPPLLSDSPPLLEEPSPPLAATELPKASPAAAAPAETPTAPTTVAPIDAEPSPSASNASAAAPPETSAPSEHGGLRAAAWALTVVGVVGVGGGVTLFVLGDLQASSLIKRANTYNAAAVHSAAEYAAINQGRSQVQLFDTLMYVAGGVGVAALATGIGFFVASSGTTSKTEVHVQLMPNLGGLSMIGSF